MGGLHEREGEVDKDRFFSGGSPSKSGGSSFGLAGRIILSGGSRSTKKPEYDYLTMIFSEKEEDGGARKGIYGYPYLKHTI